MRNTNIQHDTIIRKKGMDVRTLVLKIARLNICSPTSTLNELPEHGPNGHGEHEQEVSTADRTRNEQDHPSEQNNDKHEEEDPTVEDLDEAEMLNRTRGQTEREREKEGQEAKHEKKEQDTQKKTQKRGRIETSRRVERYNVRAAEASEQAYAIGDE